MKTKKTLFILLTCTLMLQLLILAWYQQFNRINTNSINRKLIQEQILLLVQRVRHSSNKQLPTIIQNSMVPGHKIITKKPKWVLQITKQNLWDIHKIISKSDNIKISVKLPGQQWLNLNINTVAKQSWVQTLIVAISITIFFTTLLLIWLLFRYTVPLQKIRKTANDFGTDIHAKPIPMHGPKIARDTFSALNTMQQKIKKLMNERTKMLATISHDLRTPLTRLRLRSNQNSNKEYNHKNMQDIDEMESMISQIMNYAYEDINAQAMNKIDITALLIAICNDYIDRNMKVKYCGSNNQYLTYGNSLALKRAFVNVIENGLKYATSVCVKIKPKTKFIDIIFHDDGPGIQPNQISKVFDPFYRIDQTGTGLGLTIVKNIINSHCGKVKLRNHNDGGLQVIISLPLF